MSLAHLGSMTLGALCPLAAGAVVPMGLELNAKLTGALALQTSLSLSPPTLLAAANAAVAAGVALQALVTAGLEFPPPVAQVGAIADLITSIRGTLGAIGVLSGLFAEGGVDVYTYDGPANGLGPALSAALPGPGQEFAIVLSAGADVGVRAALLSFFGGAA